jgi:hypothetical protein
VSLPTDFGVEGVRVRRPGTARPKMLGPSRNPKN